MVVTSVNGGGGPSKMAIEAMCIGVAVSSMWRNDESSGLRRCIETSGSVCPLAPHGTGPGTARKAGRR